MRKSSRDSGGCGISNIAAILKVWRVLMDSYPNGMTAYMISKRVVLPISSVYAVVNRMVSDGILIRRTEKYGRDTDKSVYVLNSAFVNREIYKNLEKDMYNVIVEFLREGIPCIPDVIKCGRKIFDPGNSVCRDCVFGRLVNISAIYVTSVVYDILYNVIFEAHLEAGRSLDVK